MNLLVERRGRLSKRRSLALLGRTVGSETYGGQRYCAITQPYWLT